MPRATHVFVIVPAPTKEDPTVRSVPVPQSEAVANGGLLIAVPGKRYALPWSTYTRKRVRAGDFVLVNAGGTRVDTGEAAAAPADIKLLADGSVDPDQRPDTVINAEAEAAAKAEAAKAARSSSSSSDAPARKDH